MPREDAELNNWEDLQQPGSTVHLDDARALQKYCQKATVMYKLDFMSVVVEERSVGMAIVDV
jgi:hypothetical protein